MHPAFFFIKYLIVALPDASLEVINDNLLTNGISTTNSEIVEKARKEIGKLPQNFKPWDSSHPATSRWLHNQKISSIIRQDSYVNDIRKFIIEKPRDRETLEKLLLSNMSAKEACYRLSKIDINISDLTISAYRHYFWNTDIMSLSQWADYFQNDDSCRISASKGLYKVALYADPEATLLRVGIKKQLDSKKIMKEVQEELYATFLETKTLPLSIKKVGMLTDLARSLAKIDERVQAGDSALLETLKKFEKFKILTPDNNIKKISALSKRGTNSNRGES